MTTQHAAITTAITAIDRAATHLNHILTTGANFTHAHDAQNALAGARAALEEATA